MPGLDLSLLIPELASFQPLSCAQPCVYKHVPSSSTLVVPFLAVPKAGSAPGSLQVPPAPTLSTVPAAGLTWGRDPLHTWLEAGITESGLLVRPSDSNSRCPSSTWGVGWHGRQAVCLGLPNPARNGASSLPRATLDWVGLASAALWWSGQGGAGEPLVVHRGRS